jgi:uncharacterized protein DUF3313
LNGDDEMQRPLLWRRKKMKVNLSVERLSVEILCVVVFAALAAGCSQTAAPEPNLVQRAQGETPAPPPPSGFLGKDYSLLQPAAAGSDQQAQLRYIASNVQWSKYTKIMVLPVTFWADDDSKVSAKDQEILCNYFYVTLVQYLSKNFEIAYGPGPDVARLEVALSDATSAIPVLRSISVVVPQARVLNLLKYAATGTYAFVGSATAEAKLKDSETGELLAAWADQRFGGVSVKNVTVWQQGDAENAMKYWANGLDQKMVTLGAGKPSSANTAAR